MPYDVVIQRAIDGETRTYTLNVDWHEPQFDGDDPLFIWTDGNFACDCNREDFFRRAGGETELDDVTCGDSRYLIVRFELPDGRIIEGPDAAAAAASRKERAK